MRKPFILLYFLGVSFSLWSQNQIQGIVTDKDKTPLPFVNILINDSQTRGLSTDIDGRFQIVVADTIYALTFSYVGYQTARLALNGSEDFLEVQMEPSAYGIAEIVVIAGENPADVVIRKAVANRKRNHPESLDSYQCETYNKVVFTLTPKEAEFEDFISGKDTAKAYFRRYHNNMYKLIDKMKEQHLFIMESVTQRHYQSPQKYRETVLHNRVAGFKAANFTALANDIQAFSFYDEQLQILDKTFLNPISKGSAKQYFFHLQDSLYQGRDTIFIIQFHPRKGKNFEGLSGLLYIHSNGYAVQNVIAEPADSGFIQLRIEQQYALVDDRQWFPEQLNFVLHARKYPNPYLGMKIYGKSYIDRILINPNLDKKLFKRPEQTHFTEDANFYSDSLWNQRRKEPLDELEQKTYEVVDEAGEKLKLDKRLRQLEALSSGRFPLSVFDISAPDLIAFNEFENTRLGLGLYTNDRISKFFSIGGYGGYGFADRAWKYGASLTLKLDKASETELHFIWRKDILEPAVANFSLNQSLVSRRFFATRMDQIEEQGFLAESSPFKYLKFRLGLKQQRSIPFGEYTFIPEPEEKAPALFYFAEGAFSFRYAFRENYVAFLGTKIPQSTAFPIFELHYKKGFKNWLKGDFEYQKWLFSIDHTFSLKKLGETEYRIEAGYLQGSLPFAKLFNSSGFGRDFKFLTIGHAFQTMDRYEFLSDRFIHFFFQHHFGSLLFKNGKLKPELSVVNNLAFGRLDKPERHEGVDFNTLEKGYYEAGLTVENLLRINYFNFLYLGLGLGAYYRYGPYTFARFEDNLAFRLALSFSY